MTLAVWVLAIGFVILCTAVIGLFAMMGELVSRVDKASPGGESDALIPLDKALVDHAPAAWLAGLDEIPDAHLAVLIVLSSSCTSCVRVASGATGTIPEMGDSTRIIVSTPDLESGAAFVASHPDIARFRPVIDPMGNWLASQAGIDTSPAVLVFQRGVLRQANAFTSVGALKKVHVTTSEGASHVHP